MAQRPPPISHCFQLVGLELEFLPYWQASASIRIAKHRSLGSRIFALTRTCDIQRLRSPQLRYHIFKAHDGSTIQVMNDAVRLSIFLCAFNPVEQYFEAGTNMTVAALSRTFH